MQELKERILKDGIFLNGGIVKVDSFINHQLDIRLMKSIGVEFVKYFGHLPVNKIVTIEASGIAPAVFLGYLLELPVVFIKKAEPSTMMNAVSTQAHSFTKNKDYSVSVSKNFLSEKDNVIFIDDFLANGNAALAAYELINKCGANLLGMGFLIEKSFQKGGQKLRELGINIKSLAMIKELSENNIVFESES